MSVKPLCSLCCCFGTKPKTEDFKHTRNYDIQRFHNYKPTDFNQMISTRIDEKAKDEAETAAQVYKETEK